MMQQKWILFSLLGLFFFLSCSEETESPTIYLVRHAEKNLEVSGNNPPLTQKGRQRAIDLRKKLDEQNVTHLFSTAFDRNVHTLSPLAAHFGKDIHEYEWDNWKPMLDTIHNIDGGIVVICGHGDNLLPMIEYLGGQSPIDSIGPHEYQHLFKVQFQNDSTLVEHLNY